VTQATDQVHDIVGVGFGPSNLALAIAIDEYNQEVPPDRRLTSIFLEEKPHFGWHRGMLLDGATMQISFLKDLVTFRNPASDFSFVSYLHEKGRLAAFTNHQSLYPTRVEFHDYLEWCADRVGRLVTYDRQVVSVHPAPDVIDATAVDVAANSRHEAGTSRWRARNVVFGTGLRPHLPDDAIASDLVWHNEDLMYRVRNYSPDAAHSFMVVGAGQSAAETVEFLHRTFPRATVYSVFTKYGLTPADDTPFVNGIFDPATVDTFYHSPPAVKDMLVAHHRNTNYSVVDTELIEELYRRSYQEKVRDAERLKFLNMSRVKNVAARTDHVEVDVEFLPTCDLRHYRLDALIYATGYRPVDPTRYFGPLAEFCKRDSDNRLEVDLDYRVVTSGDLGFGIYLQGATEYSHGLSSTLLSNTAVRAGRIVEAIARDNGTER
jgi:L-ornithine N5-oxygenase